jgi:putative ABC transport system permease protein
MRGTFLSLSVLDRKLLRDLWHIRGQALAIALVIASGVATLILSLGASGSLEETRRTYYERYRFADIFASAKRAPNHLGEAIAQIPGVTDAETRALSAILLDIAGMNEPATGRLISIPETHDARLNRLYLREGRLPEALSSQEVAVSEAFAKAHKFRPGDRLGAIINGRKRDLLIVGIVLSPEFIYTLGPGDLVPDDRRTGILWMRYRAAAAMLDVDGAFNDVSLKLAKGAVAKDVMARLDQILEPYGGQDAYTRDDQQSHAFIDAELQQLGAMALIIPPIFLAVSVFLLNMTLSRLITLEREQIGLLKALGYSSRAVGFYYIKFVSVIALLGILIGFAAGSWLGRGMTVLYASFFHFPFLVFLMPVKYYLLAGLVSLGAALLGAIQTVRTVVAMPPAVAMQPPAPTRYKQSWLSRHGFTRRLPQSTLMIARHVIRFPLRSGLTMIGIAASIALLVVSFFSLDSIDFMIDVTFAQTNRQDVALNFNEIKNARSQHDIGRLPGVMQVETYRMVPVTLRNGIREKRVSLTGLARNTQLTQLLDRSLAPMALPEVGLTLSDKLAEILDIRLGETVRVELKSGRRRQVDLPVTGIAQGYLGLSAQMDLTALNRLMLDGHAVSGANLKVDEKSLPDLYASVKQTPAIASIALLRQSVTSFRETLAQNINIMTTVYIVLSAIIAFGVVYNSVRIQLSERGRELASLRILGFSRHEVMVILFGEVIILLIIAIPIGWMLGYLLASVVTSGMQTDLYRVPLIVSRETYAKSTVVAILSTAASAVIMNWRVARMDLIAVLKTRE